MSVIAFFAASGSSDRADDHAGLHDRTEKKVRQRIDRGRLNPADVGRHAQHGLDRAECVTLIELVPQIPAEDRWAVEHDDALHLRVEALVQERVESDLEDPHRVRFAPGGGGLQHLRRELVLDLFEGRLEQVGLAREVMVERATTDGGLLQDLLGGGGGESLLREEAPGRGDEPAPGGLGAFCLRGHAGSLTASLQTDCWYVSYGRMTPTTKTDTAQPAHTAPTLLPRRTISLSRGDVAYVDHGDGDRVAPAALFVHGVLVNADIWRNVIWSVADVRRCIAPDLPAHGATPVPCTALPPTCR